MPENWLKKAMETARKIGQPVFGGEQRLVGAAVFGVDGVPYFLQVLFVVGVAGRFEDLAGFGDALLLDQPARAAGDGEEHEEEEAGGDGGDTELPTPFDAAEMLQRDDVIGEIGGEDSEDDVELEESHQAAAPFGGSDFGDVHGAKDGRAADAEAADEAESDERRPVPGPGAAEGGYQVKHRHNAEAVAAADAVSGDAGEQGSQNGSPEGCGHRVSEEGGGKAVGLGEGGRGAGDDGGIEAEEQASEGSDDRALGEAGVQSHVFLKGWVGSATSDQV